MEPTSLTEREIRVDLVLRRLLAAGDLAAAKQSHPKHGYPFTRYDAAAEAVASTLNERVTPDELRANIEAAERHRWRLHLPQVFRPCWQSSVTGFQTVQDRIGYVVGAVWA